VGLAAKHVHDGIIGGGLEVLLLEFEFHGATAFYLKHPA
jgi:hypothetical protein